MRSTWRPAKDEVVSDTGAVASARRLTSEVGVEVLRQGGNAVDAAVAVGFCLAVVEPASSCIAGHGQMLIHINATGETAALDFSHRAPRAARADMYRIVGQAEKGNAIYRVEGEANESGHLSVGVPGVTAGLCKAHALFGTLPLEQLLEPAIHYAEEGFDLDWRTALTISDSMAELSAKPGAAAVFLPGGRPPRSGVERLVQRDLGRTLRAVARKGADALYRGEIPQAVAEDMARNGGALAAADFHDYTVQVSRPARTAYRGREVLAVPVPGGGTTELQTLGILDGFDVGTLGHNSPEYLHLFIEVARHAFADRYRYLGDPDFVPAPLEGMLSREYAEEVGKAIDRSRAALEGERGLQPWTAYADRALHDPWAYDSSPRPEGIMPASAPSAGDCTTHFGIVDGDRNMVACTQTAVGGLGSRVVVPGTGILLTNGMIVFNPRPGAANSIAGYKRGLSNMGPLLVLRDGKPFLNLGAPGGRKIMNCVTQVAMNVIDHGMGIQEAIGAPRVDAADRESFADSRIDESVVEDLRGMGHVVETVDESAAQGGFASPVGLMVAPETGRIHAGVDVFRMSEARGV